MFTPGMQAATVSTGFTIVVSDTAGHTETNSTASVVATPASTAQTEADNLYETVLGRAPDPVGLSARVQLLDSGVPLATVASDIAFAAEAQNDINNLYLSILGRMSDPVGLSDWEQALATGTSLTTVEYDIACSAEAQSDINALYERILGRSADPGGLAGWE